MKTASISQTRQNLSNFLNLVKDNQQDIIIQNRGEAEAVMIPFADYALLQEARERKRRQQAIAELRQIAQMVGERNASLSTEDAQKIADEITREAIHNLTAAH
ncbi:MAG: type II toxin-antitoxin system Phd/YefM family antitoxin [Chloroflexi bacterium]|nr:type II toxin-antitoxin system Phd/YefM family antitoxin [Chloroflexota bacterium]